MITLSKFAQLAHVSVSTASKAFSMSNEVNEKTRQEIFKLAKELGCFKKFYNAKYPKFVVAVICPEFQSQYYSRALSLIQAKLAAHNCEICVAATDFSPKTESLLLEYYHNYTNVDGIIMIEGQLPIETIQEIPIVSVSPFRPQEKSTSIQVDYESSMTELISYFHAQGVTNVGYLGEENTPEKLEAFQRAMTAIMGSADEEQIVVCKERFESGGYLAMEKLFENKSLPRAIVCAYDYFAIGAIRCILDHGLAVPDDIAVVGIDNIPEASYLNPPLSSISSRHEKLCEMAADTIMKLINHETVDSHINIQSKLYLRRSSEIWDV